LDLSGKESHKELNEFSEDRDVDIFHGITEEFLKHQEKIIFASSTRQMRAPPETLQWGDLVVLLLGSGRMNEYIQNMTLIFNSYS
jgi:hypothetical protein